MCVRPGAVLPCVLLGVIPLVYDTSPLSPERANATVARRKSVTAGGAHTAGRPRRHARSPLFVV
eukprot:scaffold40488_cov65-Phaeocystis_antarctica.AAC.8